MAQIEVQNKEGKAVGKIELSPEMSDTTLKTSLLHKAVVTEEANRRQGTQSAKTRSEVRGGGRKPYKQKKTGNARQGSIRAPHYAHGGMALAVKPRDYEKKMNRKERRSAILAAIADKVAGGNLLVADSIVFAEPRTKNATELLKAFGLQDTRRVLIVLPQVDETTYKCFRNLPNVEVRTAPAGKADEGVKAQPFSARDVLVAHKVVMVQEALAKIQEVWGK